MPRLKSGLIRCRSCYLRIQEENRAALEDQAGVCAWPRVAIELPVPSIVAVAPAPESQDTVSVGELARRAQERFARVERWKNRPPLVDVKARQAAE